MVRAAAAADAVERVGPRGDGLRLERFLFKRGGHLCAQHAEKICPHVHLLYLALDQNAQGLCAVALAGGEKLDRGHGEWRFIGGNSVKASGCRPREQPDEAGEQYGDAKQLFHGRSLLAACAACGVAVIYEGLVRKMMNGQTGEGVLS